MDFVIILLGLLQIAGGVFVYLYSVSAVHEILGAISLGMGVLAVALGNVLTQTSRARKAAEAQLDRLVIAVE